MKKLFSILLLLPFLVQSQNIYKKKSALFIGNSYTYVNNLPQMVQQIALANGDSLIVDSYAPGGYSFNNHVNDANTVSKIYSKNWDYVILQAQSQEPSFSPGQVNAQTLPYALKLDSLIKDNYACSKTVFYETWGRKFGDASNCAAYPPVCTFNGMQNRLKQSYKLFSDLTSAIMAPAGEAFRSSVTFSPNLELYQADQSHPSVEGTYLVAAVFYETLFQKSVLSNTFISSVSSQTASFLKQVAHDVVRDSLNVWNIGVNLPWADFSYSQTVPGSVQFLASSSGLTNTWNFGDGTTSSQPQPSHTYISSGTFTVTHKVNNTCSYDSASKVIIVALPVGIKETALENTRVLYPNPTNEFIWLKGFEPNETKDSWIEIYSSSGDLVKKLKFSNPIQVNDLVEGLYFIRILGDSDVQNYQFIKAGQ